MYNDIGVPASTGESRGCNETDWKRLMGHSPKGDITKGSYGYRGVEELRTEIEKIEWVRMAA